ncbi:MAG TPA: uroporphyrinogen decarboxylase family protein [Planctomycetota bacterium]|nr:uroporphyrinogen decarboxylase family protein [Planctomycetota bacterium]
MTAKPAKITPRERLLRVLNHQKTDRLPIAPVGMSPFTWHADFPAYRPVLDVAAKHCEFLAGFGLDGGFALCDPKALDMKSSVVEEGERKTETTVLRTPKGELTQIRVHDRSVGSWGMLKPFVENEDDLARMESLPFEAFTPDLSKLPAFQAKVGDAGLAYCNGIRNALLNATAGMSEEFRTLFCFSEPERLREMVERCQERLLAYVTRILDAGAGPVFRFYSIEDFVEPMMPPSFVDEFIVPYDREVVKLIHSRGRHVAMHCHGRLGAQIERMLAIGIDGTDCSECPPQNDIDLAGMIAKAEGRMFIWGYIQFETLARATPEEVDRLVREAVAAGGTEGKYVLSQAASPWMAELPGKTAENIVRMIEAGVKYGRG